MIALDRHSVARYPDWQKRALDLSIGGISAVILAPLGLIIAAVIKLTSPGPVLYVQQRIGKGAKPFNMYKFRSMTTGAAGPGITAAGDARITRVGRILRDWKLDELPQLINVLKGEMSLVGPRPETPEFVAHYSETERCVLTVRPGMTGLASIEFRNEEELLEGKPDVRTFYIEQVMPRKLAIELRYVAQQGLMLDLSILLRTLLAVLKR